MSTTLRTTFLDANTTASNFGVTLTPEEMKTLVPLGGTLYISLATKGTYDEIQVNQLKQTNVTDYVGQHSIIVGDEDLIFKLTPSEGNTKLDLDTLVSSVPFTTGVLFDVPDYAVDFGEVNTYTTTVTGLPLATSLVTIFPEGVSVKIDDKLVSDGSAVHTTSLKEGNVVELSFMLPDYTSPDRTFEIVSGDVTSTWMVKGRDRSKYLEERKLFGDHENLFRKFRFWDNPLTFKDYDLNHTAPLFKTEMNGDFNIPCLNMVITESQKSTLKTTFPMKWIGEATTLRIDSQTYLVGQSTDAGCILLRKEGGVASTSIDVEPNEVFHIDFGYPEYPELVDFQADPYSFILNSKYSPTGVLSYKKDTEVNEYSAFLVITSDSNITVLLNGMYDLTTPLEGDLTEFVVINNEHRTVIPASSFIKSDVTRPSDIFLDVAKSTSYVGQVIYQNKKLYIPLLDNSVNTIRVYVFDFSSYAIGAREINTVYLDQYFTLYISYVDRVKIYSLAGNGLGITQREKEIVGVLNAEVSLDVPTADYSLAKHFLDSGDVEHYIPCSRPDHFYSRLDIISDSPLSMDDLNQTEVKLQTVDHDGTTYDIELNTLRAVDNGNNIYSINLRPVEMGITLKSTMKLRIILVGASTNVTDSSKFFARIQLGIPKSAPLATITSIQSVKSCSVLFTRLYRQCFLCPLCSDDLASAINSMRIRFSIPGSTTSLVLSYLYSDNTTSPYNDPIIREKVDDQIQLQASWRSTTGSTGTFSLLNMQQNYTLIYNSDSSVFDAHYDNGRGRFEIENMLVVPTVTSDTHVGVSGCMVTAYTTDSVEFASVDGASVGSQMYSYRNKADQYEPRTVALTVGWYVQPNSFSTLDSLPVLLDDQRLSDVYVTTDLNTGVPVLASTYFSYLVNTDLSYKQSKLLYTNVPSESFSTIESLITDKAVAIHDVFYHEGTYTIGKNDAVTPSKHRSATSRLHLVGYLDGNTSLSYFPIDCVGLSSTRYFYMDFVFTDPDYRDGTTVYGMTSSFRDRTPRLITHSEVQDLSEDFIIINSTDSGLVTYIPQALTNSPYSDRKFYIGAMLPYSLSKLWMESGGVINHSLINAASAQTKNVVSGINAQTPALVIGTQTNNIITSVKYGYASHSFVRHYQDFSIDHSVIETQPIYLPNSKEILSLGSIDFRSASTLPIAKYKILGKFKFLTNGSDKAFVSWSHTVEAQSNYYFDAEGYASNKTDSSFISSGEMKFGDVEIITTYPEGDSEFSITSLDSSGSELQVIRSLMVETQRPAMHELRPVYKAIGKSKLERDNIQYISFGYGEPYFGDPTEIVSHGYAMGSNYRFPLPEGEFYDIVIDADYSTDLSIDTAVPIKSVFANVGDMDRVRIYFTWLFDDCDVSQFGIYSYNDSKYSTPILNGSAQVSSLVKGVVYNFVAPSTSILRLCHLVHKSEGVSLPVTFVSIALKYTTFGSPLSTVNPQGLCDRERLQNRVVKGKALYDLNPDPSLLDMNYVPMLYVINDSSDVGDFAKKGLDTDHFAVEYVRPTKFKNISKTDTSSIENKDVQYKNSVIQDLARKRTFYHMAFTDRTTRNADHVVFTETWDQYEHFGKVLGMTPTLTNRDESRLPWDVQTWLGATTNGLFLHRTKDTPLSDSRVIAETKTTPYSVDMGKGKTIVITFNDHDAYQFSFNFNRVPSNPKNFKRIDVVNVVPATITSSSQEVIYTLTSDKFIFTKDPSMRKLTFEIDINDRDFVYWLEFEQAKPSNEIFIPFANGKTAESVEFRSPDVSHQEVIVTFTDGFIIRYALTYGYFSLNYSAMFENLDRYTFNPPVYRYAVSNSVVKNFYGQNPMTRDAYMYLHSPSYEKPVGYLASGFYGDSYGSYALYNCGTTESGHEQVQLAVFNMSDSKNHTAVAARFDDVIPVGTFVRNKARNQGVNIVFDAGESLETNGLRSLNIARQYLDSGNVTLAVDRLSIWSKTPIDKFIVPCEYQSVAVPLVMCSLYPEVNSKCWRSSGRTSPKYSQLIEERVANAYETAGDTTAFIYKFETHANLDIYADGTAIQLPYELGSSVLEINSSVPVNYSQAKASAISNAYMIAQAPKIGNIQLQTYASLTYKPHCYRHSTNGYNVVWNGESVEELFRLYALSDENVAKVFKSYTLDIIPYNSKHGNGLRLPLVLNKTYLNPEISFDEISDCDPETWYETPVKTMVPVSDGISIDCEFPSGIQLYLNGGLYTGEGVDADGLIVAKPLRLVLTNRDTFYVRVKTGHVYGDASRFDFKFNATHASLLLTSKSLDAEYNDKPDFNSSLYDWTTLDTRFLFDLPTKVIKAFYNKNEVLGILGTIPYMREHWNHLPNSCSVFLDPKPYKLVNSLAADLNHVVNALPEKVGVQVAGIDYVLPEKAKSLAQELKSNVVEASTSSHCASTVAVASVSTAQTVAAASVRPEPKLAASVTTPKSIDFGTIELSSTEFDMELKSSIVGYTRSYDATETTRPINLGMNDRPTTMLRREITGGSWSEKYPVDFPRLIMYKHKRAMYRGWTFEWRNDFSNYWIAERPLARLIGAIWIGSSHYRISKPFVKLSDAVSHAFNKPFARLSETSSYQFNKPFVKISEASSYTFDNPYEVAERPDYAFFDRYNFLSDVRASNLLDLAHYTVTTTETKLYDGYQVVKYTPEYTVFSKPLVKFDNTFTTIKKLEAKHSRKVTYEFKQLTGIVNGAVYFSSDLYSAVYFGKDLVSAPMLAMEFNKFTSCQSDGRKSIHANNPNYVLSSLNVLNPLPATSSDVATEERIPGYFATESEARLDAEDKGYVDTGEEDYTLIVYEYLPNHWAWSIRFSRVGFVVNSIVSGYIRGG